MSDGSTKVVLAVISIAAGAIAGIVVGKTVKCVKEKIKKAAEENGISIDDIKSAINDKIDGVVSADTVDPKDHSDAGTILTHTHHHD